MVTLGSDGCLLKTKAAAFRAPAPAVHPIDTTGAGDIFGGSAVARLLELDKAPQMLTQEDLRYIASYALMAASLSTERIGGIPSIRKKKKKKKKKKLKQLIIQLRRVMLFIVSEVKVQMISQSRSTTFSKVANTSLRKPVIRSSFHICSMGFISGVYGGM